MNLWRYPMDYTKRFEKGYRGFLFNYSIKWRSYKNKESNNEYWQSEDVKFVGVRLADTFKWFDCAKLEYDSYSIMWVTIFGIEFFRGKSCQAEKLI